MLRQSMIQNSVKLALFAMVTAAILAYTYDSTKEQIAEQIKIAKEKALLEIVPKNQHDNNMLDDVYIIPETDLLERHLKAPNTQAFIAIKNGSPVSIIFPAVAPDGYSGSIEMIVGINIDGTVAGVRVTDHKETPGLGDGITLKKGNWILSFNGKSLKNMTTEQWKVKKDKGEFDQFTGATITPRAVVKQVHSSLEYFEQNKAIIFPELFGAKAIITPQPTQQEVGE